MTYPDPHPRPVDPATEVLYPGSLPPPAPPASTGPGWGPPPAVPPPAVPPPAPPHVPPPAAPPAAQPPGGGAGRHAPPPRRSGAPTAARVLAFVAIAPMIAGLLLPGNGRVSLVDVPLWALFGIGLTVLLAVAVATAPPDPGATGQRLVLVCGTALAAFWVLLVLPVVASDTGFLLTLATALGCTAAWLARPADARGSR